MVAHAGHVLIDVATFLVPVGTVAVVLLIAHLRGRAEERGRGESPG